MKKIVLGSEVGLLVGLGLNSCTPMPSVVLAPPLWKRRGMARPSRSCWPARQSVPSNAQAMAKQSSSLIRKPPSWKNHSRVPGGVRAPSQDFLQQCFGEVPGRV